MLAAHSGIGLAVSVLMYVICLTGTIAVLFQEFERWEQPLAQEYQALSPSVMQRATDAFYQQVPESEKALYIVLPTESLPRAHIADADHEWWLNADGSLGDPVASDWTHLLTQLHVNLHLPDQIGLVIVGMLGVMLTALIISGVFAHHRILKDAFRLRWGGTGQQQQIDLHNRLSVWALPFHFVIAGTGAFFGIVGLLIVSATSIYYQGDQDALIADVYGGDPIIEKHSEAIQFEKAFATLNNVAPDAEPIYAVIQNPRTETQYLEIAATIPGRLIYSEIYRFSADGNYLDHQGFSDGPISRQTIYSVYRIHFGHFGGYAIKALYVLLGLSLTVVCVTGINIWLNKRGFENWVNHAWSGFVWGTPAALALACIVTLLSRVAPIVSFLIALSLCVALALKMKQTAKSNLRLVQILSISQLLLLIVHTVKFLEAVNSEASLIINSFVVFWIAVSLYFWRYFQKRLFALDEKQLNAGVEFQKEAEPNSVAK